MSVKERPLLAKALPATRPGRFPIGRLQLDARKRPREEVAWDPWSRDQPHCLVSGETGSGKSRLLELWALCALDWGWQVQVLDRKGGSDFFVAQAHGAQVVSDEFAISSCLMELASEIDRRNAVMSEAPVVAEVGGRIVETRATRLSDLPPSMREDIAPRLVLLDEAASLVKLPKNGIDYLRRAVQLGRSAGVHLVLSIQRPDAEFLSGFVKHNIGDRILLGAPRTAAADQMMFELPPDDERTKMVRHSPRGRQVALVQGCGLNVLSRVRITDFHREHFLPDAPDPRGHEMFEPDHVSRETAVVSTAGLGPGKETSDEPWFQTRSEPPRSGPRVFAPPYGRGQAPRVRLSKSPRARIPGSWTLRFRAALRGPFARLRLRAASAKLLSSPLADAPRTRNPELRRATLARDGYVCAACGRVHHDGPQGPRPIE